MNHLKFIELVRYRLEEELEELWDKVLIIVAAPSGYGKTTLVRGFLQKHPEEQTIWLSCGQNEVEETWVWKTLCDKCCEVSEVFAGKLREMGLPRSVQEMDYLVMLIKEHMHTPVSVILDDFQECNSVAINGVISKLAYAGIEGFHIVLITRVYPSLPYEEMFLRGYCGTMDQLMLTLDRKETNEIFCINGFLLSEEELTKIFEYTDGWISAVYLVLFEYRRTGELERFSSASNLLKTAIFDKLPSGMQDLYMKMSLFDSFTMEEAIYVSKSTMHPMVIKETIEQFGFMQYDLKSKRYEMHALLRTVAVNELERRGVDKSRLYDQDGEWYEKNNFFIFAIKSYRNADNLNAIFRILSGEMHHVIMEEALNIVHDIFTEAPIHMKAKYPTAWLSYIYTIIMKDEVTWGEYLYEEARTTYGQMEDSDKEKQELRGELLIIRSLLEFNELDQINSSLKEAYELLGCNASKIFRQTLLNYGAPTMTTLYYNKSGELKHTIMLEKEYAQYHMRLVGAGDEGWDDLFDAEYALWTGNIENAYKLAIRVMEKAVFRKQYCIVITSYFLQFRSLLYFGRTEEFSNCMKAFTKVMRDVGRTVLIVDYDLAYSFPFACMGRKEKVKEWICNFDLAECSRVVRSARDSYITYGMLLCKTGQWLLLDSIAEQCVVPCERTKHMYCVIYGYIFKAIAAQYLSGHSKAKEFLSRALMLAEPDEIRMPFIECGEELLGMTEGIGSKNKFCYSLIPSMKQYQRSIKLFKHEEEKTFLTKREQELMELVKEGYRNNEISDKMCIALVTVEKKLTSVYRKLNVSNRAAAIARYKESL